MRFIQLTCKNTGNPEFIDISLCPILRVWTHGCEGCRWKPFTVIEYMKPSREIGHAHVTETVAEVMALVQANGHVVKAENVVDPVVAKAVSREIMARYDVWPEVPLAVQEAA